MIIWFKAGSVIFLGAFAIKCVVKLIEGFYNLQALRYEEKHPGFLPRSGAGIVFNKETGKLEETAGEVILPFD